jgi:hypothetical protein
MAAPQRAKGNRELGVVGVERDVVGTNGRNRGQDRLDPVLNLPVFPHKKEEKKNSTRDFFRLG